MAKKRTSEANDLSKVTVRLKPFLGMEPGLYLTILYALILLLIIFLLLFLPGVRHFGSEVAVTTQPEGAAIYVDGRYVGATPRTVFVSGGSHDLSVQKPFYAGVDNKIDVGGRLFGSLFIPRREGFSYNLKLNDLNGLLRQSFHDVSQWAMVNHFLPNYQPPPIVQDTVGGALQSASFSDRKALWTFLESVMGDVHNQYLLNDFTAAVAVLAGKSSVATPQRLLSTLTQHLGLGSRYPDLIFWLAYAMPAKERTQLEATAAFKQAATDYLSTLHRFKQTERPVGSSAISVDGMRFLFVPGGSFIMGAKVGQVPDKLELGSADLPHIATVPDYYMMTTDVTHGDYVRFITKNPKWAPSATSTLTKNGLATSDYLRGWATSLGPDYPQAYVSYYAAEAFCEWLQKRLPPSLAGYRVMLPSAADWEWVARMNVSADRSVFHDSYDSVQPAGTGAPNSLGIRDLLGNLWQWTSSWYLPAGYFLTSADGSTSLTTHLVGDGAEKAVRGGSWASSVQGISYTTRGSQPPDWCTAYLGFRPIIVKE